MTFQSADFPLNADEIYRAIDIDQSLDITDAKQLIIHQDFENFRPAIERFVLKVVHSEKLGYAIKKDSSGRPIVRELAFGQQHFSALKAYVQAFIPGYYFSPHVELFFQCCRYLSVGDWASLKPQDRLSSGLFVGEIFNCLLCELRKGVKRRKFTRKLAARELTTDRAFKSCKNYFNTLMDVYARLLVLRVDFGYRKDYAASVSPKELKSDLKRFLDSKRTSPRLTTLVGYIWRLEYGDEKKLHLHMVFFLNGSESQNDPWLAEEYGKQWQSSCASGMGIYFNCNRKKLGYKFLGVGRIEYHSYEKRWNFINKALAYLAKKEQYILSKLTRSMRCMGHGEAPDKSGLVRLGRPRSKLSDL